MNDGNIILPDWVFKESDGDYLEVGARFCTRDGRIIGNAIVDKIYEEGGGKIIVIETEAKCEATTDLESLQKLFYPPRQVMEDLVEDYAAGYASALNDINTGEISCVDTLIDAYKSNEPDSNWHEGHFDDLVLYRVQN